MSTRIAAGNVRLKRAYERPSTEDGTRILIDRLWPRGVSKENAALGLWMKDIAPSAALRTWFGHDPARWQEFRAGTSKRSGGTQCCSASCGRWHGRPRSRWCIRRTTRLITTRSS